MLVFYVDEFGDTSMKTEVGVTPPRLFPGTSQFFVLSAVGIPDSSRKPLAEALFALKTKHFGPSTTAAPWGDTEIKGRFVNRVAKSVSNGKTLNHPVGYRSMSTQTQVDAFIKDLGLIFTQFRPLVFSVTIDKDALLTKKNGTSPLGAAYAYLNQRIALAMERLHSGQGAILVADQQTQHEKFFRSGAMNAERDAITRSLANQPNFNLVLDKPLWVDTDLSTWDREIIQLADIVAYSTAEAFSTGKRPNQASHLWDEIWSSFAVHWTTGQVRGAGLSVHPGSATFPTI